MQYLLLQLVSTKMPIRKKIIPFMYKLFTAVLFIVYISML